MRQSINTFHSQAAQFDFSVDAIKTSWQDNIGDAFYRDIIQPLRNNVPEMKAAMQRLQSQLEQLKSQIDAI